MRTIRRITAVAALAVAALAIGTGVASAHVDVYSPVKVVLSGPSAIVRIGEISARGDGALHVCHREIDNGVMCSGNVTALLSSAAVLGQQRWEAENELGEVHGVLVTVLRATRLNTGPLTRIGVPGVVAGYVHVTHYENLSNTWTGAAFSPVQVQTRNARGVWTTVATWTTDSTGLAHGTAKIGSASPRNVRFVRPEGARDAAAVSK